MNPSSWIALVGLIFTMGCAIGGALVWFVRLEGRVDKAEALHAQFKEQHEKEHDSMSTTVSHGFAEVKGLIQRLFDRLDDKADKPRG